MKSFYNRIISPVSGVMRSAQWVIVIGLLATMFGLGLGSMWNNSAIIDEIAHIPSGYSYLHYGDYRLNPEHPPLMKDLSGLPLQFMHLKFPDTMPAWTTDANGQWESGWNFIYHLGNDADRLIFWARLPLLVFAVLFGALLFWLVRRIWGVAVGLMTLFLYVLSPSILGHSSLVTTDVGASAFMFLALVAFARYVARPHWGNVLLLSLALFGAQVAKFSSFLLYPFLLLVTLVLVWAMKKPVGAWVRLKIYTGGLVVSSIISIIWVWLFYTPHVWNMPASVQDHLINQSLVSDKIHFLAGFLTSMNDVVIFKPLVQYLLGLAMVFGRVAGGNVTYFNGEVANGSFVGYFPELWLVKTQVALLILAVIVLAVAFGHFFGRRLKLKTQIKTLRSHIAAHVLEWTLGAFAGFYFVAAIAGNLNLGIRHILPVYIPIFILVAIGTVRVARRLARTKWRWASAGALMLLLGWYGVSCIAVYPSFISYFNELIGGPSKSDKYFSDSSVDWGQDLRRLKAYVDEHPEIDRIAVDYFGGGAPQYYFCHRKYDSGGKLIATSGGYDCTGSVFQEWHSQNGRYPGQYIAVSETFLENDRYYSALNNEPGYAYLRDMEPVARIGDSIFVYKMY